MAAHDDEGVSRLYAVKFWHNQFSQTQKDPHIRYGFREWFEGHVFRESVVSLVSLATTVKLGVIFCRALELEKLVLVAFGILSCSVKI